MSMKRVLAAFMGVTLMVGNGPVSVLAEETEQAAEAAASTQIVNLETQGRTNPIGVDEANPAFSWQMESGQIGAAQKAYQIVVQDPEGNVVWDSGVVESSQSNEVKYEGTGLTPATQYSWNVTVTDNQDNAIQSEIATFETGLMDTSTASWDGAKWIGAGELSLDAASKAVFNISADLQVAEGSNAASFILGADDFRLENKVFNSEMQEGENYVRVELDLSGVGANGGAKINAYRMGYAKDDDPTTPFFTIEDNEDLNTLITDKNKNEAHHINIFCTASTLSITVDGTKVGDDILVNTMENGNTFPNLNSVGFAANAGDSATFTDYKIENGGKYATGTLLDAETGATYSIFDGMDGVTVDGNIITVNGGDAGVLGYADPSYAAAPMVRTDFEAKSEIESARLYLTAQGIYDFYINGQEVAPEEWFNPGSTEYDSILAYNSYDVTDYLQAGENAMGAILGEGWWTGMTTFECTNNNYYGDQPALMAKLVVN